MKLKYLVDKLGITVFCGKNPELTEVTGGYTSDLLSDVMGKAKEGNIWITMQTHKNIIAVASLKELSAIVLVNGNKPDEETLYHAEKEGVSILSVSLGAFEISGEIYNLLKGNELL